MRDINFRGLKVDGSGWVYGYYVQGVRAGNIRSYIQDIEMVRFEVNPDTIGQFTGLKDKNGTDIYEGDFIQEYDKDMMELCRSQIKYLGCAFHICNKRTGNIYLDQIIPTRINIIGNIHENPELPK